METARTLQGRRIGSNELSTIRELIAEHPDWHRTRLSQALCERWAWVNKKGHVQDMAARALLRKLDDAGLIELPAPVQSANNAFRNRAVTLEAFDLDRVPIETRLSALQPIGIRPVAKANETRLFRGLLQQYHYLGYRGPVGENLHYLSYDRHGRLLGCLSYGAAAWRMADRDRFIGWDESAREQNLSYIANNRRFLILPWVRVAHLASHLLALSRRRICAAWQAKYGHPIVLLESFVEQARFTGTCYQADNWMRVGQTRGRGRNHNSGDPNVAIKSIWLYPLHPRFREWLTAGAAGP
jgi:hypothetical protein